MNLEKTSLSSIIPSSTQPTIKESGSVESNQKTYYHLLTKQEESINPKKLNTVNASYSNPELVNSKKIKFSSIGKTQENVVNEPVNQIKTFLTNLMSSNREECLTSKELVFEFSTLVNEKIIFINGAKGNVTLKKVFCQNATSYELNCFYTFLIKLYQYDTSNYLDDSQLKIFVEDFKNAFLNYDYIAIHLEGRIVMNEKAVRLPMSQDGRDPFGFIPLLKLPKTSVQINHSLEDIQTDISSLWYTDLTDFKKVVSLTQEAQELDNDYVIQFDDKRDQTFSSTCDLLFNQIEKQASKFYHLKRKQAKQGLPVFRYPDILTYDTNNLYETLGYVLDASPIKTISGRRVIATQAPQSITVKDFWRAVWIEQSSVIVMLTACQEESKSGRLQEKCPIYWPTSSHDSLTIEFLNPEDDLKISFIEERSNAISQQRVFELKQGQETRLVHQVHVEQWKDHDVVDLNLLSDLISLVEQLESQHSGSTFVHCHAGVGRTGVFLTCHSIRERLKILLEKTKDLQGYYHPELIQLDLEKLLINCRQQRAMMIQTKEQFKLTAHFFDFEIKSYLESKKHF